MLMTIEKDAEDIIEKFSKILEDIPDSDETWYITDNLNLTREDKSQEKNPEKILRNAKTLLQVSTFRAKEKLQHLKREERVTVNL